MSIYKHKGMKIPEAERILWDEIEGDKEVAEEVILQAVKDGFEVTRGSHKVRGDHEDKEVWSKEYDFPSMKPCPFCGRKMILYSNRHKRDNGRIYQEMYFMHEDYDINIDTCILDEIGMPFTIGAGDAKPEEGYLGEYAELWNRRV